jgi:Fur family peroxide stress response transcriptional regulator
MLNIQTFKSYGIKPSITRIKIYEYLLHHPHPSVDDIYQALKNELPTLSKTTVYNVLKVFLEHNMVTTLSLDSKELKYEVNHQPHAHFQCMHCGDITDLPFIDVDYQNIHQKGMIVQSHDLLIKGICQACSQS